MQDQFREYQRKANKSQMRPYREGEKLPSTLSISDVDRKNGSPKVGDMISRNPEDHSDQWLVSKEFFETNFEKEPVS